MNIKALPLVDVVSREDVFACTPLANDHGVAPIISALCCVGRQAHARKGIGGDVYRPCRQCSLGRVIERQTGGPVVLGASADAEERARHRGGYRGRLGRAKVAGKAKR